MDRSDIVDYCLSKPGAWLDSPWGEGDNVAKVGDKIFCSYGGERLGITVKNTRDDSYDLVVASLPKSKRPS